jgi:hypothetical protein
VTDFVDAVRKCMKDGGIGRTDSSVETGGTFLVGYAGRLFKIESDYQVGEPILPYDACGCGEDFAKGAMFNSEHLSPELRIKNALVDSHD